MSENTEIELTARGMTFCDNGHDPVCYVSEHCPACKRDVKVSELQSANDYLNSQVDEMRIELEDLREKAKAHRLI
jgi:transcription initiation factor IIE alpha subunit